MQQKVKIVTFTEHHHYNYELRLQKEVYYKQ